MRPGWRYTDKKMDRPKRLEIISKKLSAVVKAVLRPKFQKGKISLRSLPAELQLSILHHLPLTLLPTICLLNKHWCSAGTDELRQRLFPNPTREIDMYGMFLGRHLMYRAIRHLLIPTTRSLCSTSWSSGPRTPTSARQTRPSFWRSRQACAYA